MFRAEHDFLSPRNAPAIRRDRELQGSETTADLRFCNNPYDRLRVLIKDEGEELVLSRGEAAYVLAAGVGGYQPTFTVVMGEDSIEVSASHAQGYFLSKEPPESKNSGKQTSGGLGLGSGRANLLKR